MDIIKLRGYLFNIVRAGWLFCMVYIFFEIMFQENFKMNYEFNLVMCGILALFTFPVGLVLEFIFLYFFQFEKVGFVLVCVIVIISGYYQWFVFVPKILAKDEKARLKELEELSNKNQN